MIEPSSGTLRPSSTRAESRLAGARLADEAQRLACFEVEVDADDGAHVLATDVEGLRHTPQADHRLTASVRAPQRDVLRRRSWQLRRLFVIVAARGPPVLTVVHRWRLFQATLVSRERSALRRCNRPAPRPAREGSRGWCRGGHGPCAGRHAARSAVARRCKGAGDCRRPPAPAPARRARRRT